MQTEVTLKYRANNRCHRADQAEHGTPEHMHTNTHSSDHETLGTPPRRAPRVPWVSSLLLACSAPPACAVRAALAPSRRRNRTPCAQPRALPPRSRPPCSRPCSQPVTATAPPPARHVCERPQCKPPSLSSRVSFNYRRSGRRIKFSANVWNSSRRLH